MDDYCVTDWWKCVILPGSAKCRAYTQGWRYSATARGGWARGRRTKVGRVKRPAGGAFAIQTWQRLPALSCSTGATTPPAPSIYTVCVCVCVVCMWVHVCVHVRVARARARAREQAGEAPSIYRENAAKWNESSVDVNASFFSYASLRDAGCNENRAAALALRSDETARL